MRVVAGTARSLRLKTIDSLETRPTTDRIKETLFNMIQNDVPGAVFLDLFAGSGGIGIEALSRGAREAVFVDNNRGCVQCIEQNLSHTHFAEVSRVVPGDAMLALRKLEGTATFSVVFMDPPYNKEFEKEILTYLKDSAIIDEDTLIIVEASIETDFDYAEDLGFTIRKEKNYKTNKHVFLKRKA